ncbi:hypothetical protein FACS1894185_4810 [Betaproteobacteria bacterium]|nr:hypothetical protein FACS1894185_4810 [Betaproteobacteria bacterium]
MNYFTNMLIAIDQLANALLCGKPDETLSARAWRDRDKHPVWPRLIDALFFWQPDHCQQACQSEVLRAHLPRSYR